MYSFSDIKGNEKLKKIFITAKKEKRVLNSYILEGDGGSGKMFIAKCFAKYIQCEEDGDASCDRCRSCVSFNSDNNPDVIYIKRESKKATIGVDEIREKLVKDAFVKPFSSKYKIYIIDDADKMTAAAQNAFLKTLEEPPEYAVFILLAENIGNFLVTIISRCTVFKTERISSEIIENYLVENDICPKDRAEVVSKYCGGSIGMAIETVNDEEFNSLRNDTFKIFLNIKNDGIKEIYEDIAFLEENKKSIGKILDIAVLFYRDALVCKCLKSDKFTINKDKISQIGKLASETELRKLTENVGIILKTQKRLKENANFLQTMEVMFFELKENKQ